MALLRSAELMEQGKRIWANQNLPLEMRTRKVFLMSLKWQLGEWGFLRREIEIDDEFSELRVGDSIVFKLSAVGRITQCDWTTTWAKWEDLQTSLKQMLVRANDSLQRDCRTKGNGKTRSGVAAATSQGQLRSGPKVLTSTSHTSGYKPVVEVIKLTTDSSVWTFGFWAFTKNVRLHTPNRLAEMLSLQLGCDIA